MLAFCLGSIAPGCRPAADQPVVAPQNTALPTLEAEVVQVARQSWPAIVRAQGSVMADEVSVVGAKVAGSVAEVHVDLGDLVQEAQPLISLDQEEFRLQVEQAEAQLAQARAAVGLQVDEPVERLDPRNAAPVRQEQALWDEAKANLARAERLRAQNVIAQAEFDQLAAAQRVAEARYAAALNAVREKVALIGVRQAELSLAREQLRNAVIRAPFHGLVQQRQVAPGSYLQIGNPVVTLVRTHPLRFRGAIPERHAQHLSVGQSVQLQIESLDQPRSVHVTRISPALDPLSRSLIFEAEIDNQDSRLRSGLFAEAEVVVDPEAQVLVVPQSAVVEFAGLEKVWRVVDGVAQEQTVLSGRRGPSGIEIVEGLEEGDVVLLSGSEGRVAAVKPIPGDIEGQLEQRAELTGRDEDSRRKVTPTESISG